MDKQGQMDGRTERKLVPGGFRMHGWGRKGVSGKAAMVIRLQGLGDGRRN